MTLIQRFFLAIVPRSIGKAMEKHSRLWMIRCLACSHEISVWDAGGIRYLAAGRPRRLRRCTQCGEMKWHLIYKTE